jgi:hypothetical protein
VADEEEHGLPGLAHITVSGAIYHGNKEVRNLNSVPTGRNFVRREMSIATLGF